jgi:hypothetical protein
MAFWNPAYAGYTLCLYWQVLAISVRRSPACPGSGWGMSFNHANHSKPGDAHLPLPLTWQRAAFEDWDTVLHNAP